MGRTIPQARVSQDVYEEVALAQVVNDAVARVLPAQRPDASDEEAVEQVLNELASSPGETAAAARPIPVPRPPTGPPDHVPIVFLDAIEVTQEIQDLAQSVPLVAGRPTIVRAYLRYSRRAITVRGELRVARAPHGPWQTIASVGPAQLDPSRSGGSLAELRSRRADLGFSLNFLLPTNLVTEGTLWMRMGRVRRATTGTTVPSLAGLQLHTAAFQQAVPLRMRLVRFRYTMGNPPTTHEPSATDIALIESWLRRAYPIDRLELSATTATATPNPPFGAAQINAQLIALRAVDVSTGTDARTHYYGMVADSGFFMRGLAAGIPQTPQPETVASGPTGPSTFGWDSDGSYGDWYGGHELGHTVGRPHAEFCGAGGGAPYPFSNGQLSDADEAFVGIDVGDPPLGLPMRVVGGTTSHDVMSYCDNQWLSSFTYSAIYQRLVAEDGLPAGAGSGPGIADTMTVTGGAELAEMRVIAALNLTHVSGTITSVLPSSGGGAPASEMGSYGVLVRVRDVDGATLGEWRAPFQRSVCEDPGDDVTGVVDVDIPTLEGAASVELVVDGSVVDSHPVGGQASIGELLPAEPAAAGPGEEPGGELQLRWETPAAPASQRYIVQVSDDRGATWRTVAVGLAEPAVTLSAEDLTGDEITVRILATTGSGATVVRMETVPLR
jgi:hypothetical protein